MSSSDMPEVLILDEGFAGLFDLKEFSFSPVFLPKAGKLEDNPHIKAIITNGAIGLPEALQSLSSLEMIAVCGVGIDRLPLPLLKKRKIKVSTAIGINADEVADTALMFLLNLRRNFLFNFAWLKEGLWQKSGEPPLGHSIKNAKIGIVGLGAIGQALAKRVSALGASVRYYNRSERDTSFQREKDLGQLAEWSDALILAVPGTEETYHLIDSHILEKLGSEGILINIARGSVIDENALIRALKDNKIKGAGLDVFETEPAVNPAFFELSNCILQPHQGSATLETRKAMAMNVIQNLQAYFQGKPLITPLSGLA
ncbi:2-hydroxyacid dehydrogenase [Acetobacteraceae bacterium]|nr:2-hydroxyacid dehydrogenase [Acetobacteraceae bacterium]